MATTAVSHAMTPIDDDAFVIATRTFEQREPVPTVGSEPLRAEPIPPANRPGSTPLLRLLMPVVMVAAMAAMIIVMVVSAGTINPMMLVMPLMMGMSFLMMFSPPAGADTDETRRTYLRHLGHLREAALARGDEQRAAELHRNPHPEDLGWLVGTARQWERAPEDPDALHVRVGTGPAALCTPVEVGEAGAAEDLDPVCAVSLRATVRAVNTVGGMPVVIALPAFRLISLNGPGAAGLARALICQLAVAHGPEAVSVEILGGHAQQWQWHKWLPHSARVPQARHRVLIAVGQAGNDYITSTEETPFTVVIGVDAGDHGPLHLRAAEEGLALTITDRLLVHTADGTEDIGAADTLRVEQACHLARALAAYRRPTTATAHTHSAASGLLGLLGWRALDDLTAPALWPPRPASRRLAVPLGLVTAATPGQPEATPLVIDLKESAHGGMGPHGLCIGATGSGKSELLRTLVAALAATHSPEELNFVLVDFKGGATFLGLDRLPHTSAVITNLEEESVLVERMRDAISGELNRRQEVLRQAGNCANVTDYNAARAADPTLAPLPALLIVLDEFSELLAQHPDFADLFVAVGRLGRSLHVHLLLASQRLDEGRLRGLDSHLSYRIGLRTFSAAESRQVLGVPDAHQLPSRPGAGYLKADADGVVGFQAAYVSGPAPRLAQLPGSTPDSPSAEPDVHIAPFYRRDDGEERSQAEVVLDDSTTVLDGIVDVCVAAAAQRNQRAHRIWLPPLPEHIWLAQLSHQEGTGGADASGSSGCQAAVGIIDRPYKQRQDHLVLDFSRGGGHLALCGGPRTGKTTALRTIIAALALRYSPDQASFYVLDLGGGGLDYLSTLPHVAGVAGRSQPERVERIIDEVTTLICDGPAGHGETFLVIDGWHSVCTDFEDLVEPITSMAADGPAARVHLIITTPRWTLLRPAIRDLMTMRMELRLGEAMDSLIDRKAQQQLPARPGRGITHDGEPMLLACTANQDVAHIARQCAQRGDRPVTPLKVLPESISRGQLPSTGAGIACAIGGPRLTSVAWDFDSSPHLVAIGTRGCGKSTLLASLAEGVCALGRDAARIVFIDQRRSHLGDIPEDMLAAYAATSDAVGSVLADTVATARTRLPGPDVSARQLSERSWWQGPELFVFIDDCDLIADHHLAELAELLPHARDIGLHLVVARKAGGAGRALFQPFLSALKDQVPTVVLFDVDRDEGALFGIKPTAQRPGRAIWQHGGTTLGTIHVALPESARKETA